MKLTQLLHTPGTCLKAVLRNALLVYAVYMVCRIAYLLENWKTLSEGLEQLSPLLVLKGSLMFDTSAIIYTNLPYLLLFLLWPISVRNHTKEIITKTLFVIMNALSVVLNLSDAVYFQYTGRRTTSSVFSEFSHENNLTSIFGIEILRHWYLVLLGVALIYALFRWYAAPTSVTVSNRRQALTRYAAQLLSLALVVPLCIAGMRGGFTTAVRPITISNANQYVQRPVEASLVLNTPFSLIRTYNKNVFVDPGYFPPEELDSIYSPVHQPCEGQTLRKKNVVVFIIESFGREYIGALNQREGEDYKSYTPFTDSLIRHSLTFEYSFSNGRKSIDGMPSILSSIPRFIEPFFLTPASLNKVSGLAGELRQEGYHTAFFHGAENGSMGFEAFARTTGYEKYYGRTEYNADKRFHGDADFDGTWAIWDEEFMQFFAQQMDAMPQPFVTSIFTASSHHPYVVPERYRQQYYDEPGDGNVMHKCIRYVDHALQHFFDTARRMPWYDNTIFVITADHTNISTQPEYNTDLGLFSVPIIFYDPSGEMPAGRSQAIAQQIDIMPTVLNHLGYNRPYVAFGIDLLHTPQQATWAVNHEGGIYQYVKGYLLLQFSESGEIKAVYDYHQDPLLKQNIKGQHPAEERQMERELKGIIQSYMQRMTQDRLTVAPL